MVRKAGCICFFLGILSAAEGITLQNSTRPGPSEPGGVPSGGRFLTGLVWEMKKSDMTGAQSPEQGKVTNWLGGTQPGRSRGCIEGSPPSPQGRATIAIWFFQGSSWTHDCIQTLGISAEDYLSLCTCNLDLTRQEDLNFISLNTTPSIMLGPHHPSRKNRPTTQIFTQTHKLMSTLDLFSSLPEPPLILFYIYT